jgi:hypothetical protein
MSERRESPKFGFQRYWLSKKTPGAEDIFAKNRVDKKQQEAEQARNSYTLS